MIIIYEIAWTLKHFHFRSMKSERELFTFLPFLIVIHCHFKKNLEYETYLTILQVTFHWYFYENIDAA